MVGLYNGFVLNFWSNLKGVDYFFCDVKKTISPHVAKLLNF